MKLSFAWQLGIRKLALERGQASSGTGLLSISAGARRRTMCPGTGVERGHGLEQDLLVVIRSTQIKVKLQL